MQTKCGILLDLTYPGNSTNGRIIRDLDRTFDPAKAGIQRSGNYIIGIRAQGQDDNKILLSPIRVEVEIKVYGSGYSQTIEIL